MPPEQFTHLSDVDVELHVSTSSSIQTLIIYPCNFNRVVNFAGLKNQFVAKSTHRRRTAVPSTVTNVTSLDVSIKRLLNAYSGNASIN